MAVREMSFTSSSSRSERRDGGALPAGLTSSEARARLAEAGPNAIREEVTPRWRSFAAKLWGPVPWLLEAAIVLQLGLGARLEAALIGGLLLFNALLGFVQEGRANAALAALKKRLAPTALVRRDGEWLRLAAAELVPGDAIRLPLGAIVPADARIVSGSVLVDQSTLTGESVPVDAERGATVYAGSMVQRGQAVAEVTATGSKTYFGRAAELVRLARRPSTEQAAILAATKNLALVNGSVAALLVAYAYLAGWAPAEVARLALTALLATIPVALPATFTLSAAFGARILASRGVLLTRLSAAHEAAGMDVLCADKTGTLTQNALRVAEVVPMPEFDRERVLALAAMASAEAGQDPIDTAIRAVAHTAPERLQRFEPFDPATKISQALALDRDGNALHVAKGAFEALAPRMRAPADVARGVDDLAGRGHRVIAVAAGPEASMRLAGLIALSDPPREDSAALLATLRDLGVRTVMVTGDSPVTAAAIAKAIGIDGGVVARVVPEEKYRLVKTLQGEGHVVGMFGDGVNDAPALRQAQIGIAVSGASDVAKAAAALVLTDPGLDGIVHAVREGRIAFQRLLAFTFNMLIKKVEIVLFLAIGLALTGGAVMTPTLMVFMLLTNDFLAMSLTTDRASPARAPSRWQMRNITAAGIALGVCKLAFSVGVLAYGKYRLGLGHDALQTLAFVVLVFGSQAVLFVVRERRRLWSSAPSAWVLLASLAAIGIVFALAPAGILMAPLPWRIVAAVLGATLSFALVLDQLKTPVLAAFKLEGGGPT
ncbi:MAG TPA: HAD-IC family P-type ATPase [Burkholderiales bacterium]|nr:HAD-IC family P-type ATPase [Burkholderiales bacterium]